jgi:ketosteroid isomerase-like protein
MFHFLYVLCDIDISIFVYMKYFLIAILSLCSFQGFSQKSEKDITIRYITKAMQEQEDCWNRGDIPCFMKHYWKSDSLRFIGKTGITYGWQKTLDNYNTSYPNKEAMGELTFNNLVIEFTDINTVFIVGQWKLQRKPELENLEGHYSLLWQKKDGRWVIIADHSS